MTQREQSHRVRRLNEPGAWLLTASSAAGLIAALIYYFWSGDGIAYTPGALLVVVSTALMLIVALAMAAGLGRHWLLSAFFVVSTGLDVIGTGFAAWLLEANWLLAAMALAALGWIIHAAADGPAASPMPTHSAHLEETAR